MNPKHLKKLIHRLIETEPDSSPVISCFINLEQARSSYFAEIEGKARQVAKQLRGQRLYDYEDALAEIRDFLENSLNFKARGVAIYSRWGDKPFLVPVQFDVPLESDFIVDNLPHIYPIIQMKDTYHRFVTVITTADSARILETTIGSVTEEIVKLRPDLRERIGREWTREHYRNHRDEKDQQYVKEKIKVIDDLMTRSGHNHLVIAGSPKMVSRLKKALPARLEEKLISSVAVNPKAGVDPILMEAMRQFAEVEQIESHDHVGMLESSILSGGLAVAGYEASREALTGGYADMLIIDQDYSELDLREELIRLATKFGVGIETVKESETLEHLAGVGCLLRYRPFPHEQPNSSLLPAA